MRLLVVAAMLVLTCSAPAHADDIEVICLDGTRCGITNEQPFSFEDILPDMEIIKRTSEEDETLLEAYYRARQTISKCIAAGFVEPRFADAIGEEIARLEGVVDSSVEGRAMEAATKSESPELADPERARKYCDGVAMAIELQ